MEVWPQTEHAQLCPYVYRLKGTVVFLRYFIQFDKKDLRQNLSFRSC